MSFLRALRVPLALVAVLLSAPACDTTEDPLLGPSLIGPVDSTVFDTELAVELRWNAVSEAAAYRVEIARTPDFATLERTEQTGITTLAVGPFSKGTYYWRVVPVAPGGTRGLPGGDNVFIVEDQRPLTALLAWTFDLTATETPGEVDAAASGDGGLPQELAAAGLPLTAQLRQIVFRRVTLRNATPDAGSLSAIGTAFRFFAEPPTASRPVIARLDSPGGSPSADLTILQTNAVELQALRPVLRTRTASGAAGAYTLEVNALADLIVAVP